MAEQIKAATPVLLVSLILTAVLGLSLTVGGVYIAFVDRTAKIDFNLFGATFSSTSVGVALAFIGGVIFYLSVRRALKSLDNIGVSGGPRA